MTGFVVMRDRAGQVARCSGVRGLVIALAVPILLAGCGYRPLGTDAGGPGRRVYVEAFGNDTMRPGLQAVVAAELLRQLRFRGMLRPAEESGPPELILSGRISGYENIPVAFGVQDIGRRFRVRIVLVCTLTGPPDGKVRFSESVYGEGYYTAGVGAVSATASEEEAMRFAAQDLVSKLVGRLTEAW